MNQLKGYIFTITAAVCFGLQPLLAGFVYEYGIGSKLLSFYRVFFMVPLFLVILLIRRERFWKITPKLLLQTALLALTGAVLTMFFLFESFRWIATGSATALNFSYPVVVLILGIVIFRERISRPVLISIILCMGGVKELGSQKASILAALEPVTSIVVGFLFMHEPLKWSNILGALLVITSTIVLILGGRPSSSM